MYIKFPRFNTYTVTFRSFYFVLTDTVNLTVTADNKIYVYHDSDFTHDLDVSYNEESPVGYAGTVILSNGNWEITSNIVLIDPCVLAFKAINDGGTPYGILASASSGIVTDETWKCSDVEQAGWHKFGFNDSTWHQARVIGPYGDQTWSTGDFRDINTSAKWIWASSGTTAAAYCRKDICTGKIHVLMLLYGRSMYFC